MPHRLANLPFTRVFASATNNTIGQYVPAFQVTLAALGGLYTGPIRIPLDANRKQPSRVHVDVAPTVNNALPGLFIEFQWAYTAQTPGATRREALFPLLWPVPNPWLTTDLSRVLLDDGTGYTFQANFFDPAATLGIRFARNGPAAGDTYASTVLIAQDLTLEYLVQNEWPCCC